MGGARISPRAASTAAGRSDVWGNAINSATSRREAAAPLRETASAGSADARTALQSRLAQLDAADLRGEFVAQGAFLYLQDFLPEAVTERLIEAVTVLEGSVNRNYLPGHKQGGSVSRHAIDAHAPFVAELYRSPALLAWLERLSGERLQVSPPDDPHAYAFYFYTRAGDHIGWHYDTSYYRGRRYTLLLGVIDDSSCRLDYELHTRDASTATVAGSLRYPPGALVFFDGDKLKHRISPAAAGEKRVSLTFEYVTDPHMHPWWRLISNFKDALAYFGLRQVFGGRRNSRLRGPRP